MKKKKLFIFIVLIVITLVIGLIFFSLYFTDKKTSNEINIEKDERESIPIDNPNDIKENINIEVEEDNNINEENNSTENIKSNNINSSNSVDKNDTKETSKNSANKGKTNQNEDSKVVEENKDKENNKNSTTTETKSDDNKNNDNLEKQEIWEVLGMTKDQYYNEPLFSWERVDFKTMAECLNYGDNYEPYLNGEVLYNCRDVVSASGNYLGVMFETEKLK